MRAFWSLFLMNFKRTMKSWMIILLTFVMVVAILVLCIFRGVNPHDFNISSDVFAQAEDTISNMFMITTIAIYLFIIMCGGAITTTVALERTSKIYELLAYRVSCFMLLYSKIIALFFAIFIIGTICAIEIYIFSCNNMLTPEMIYLFGFFKSLDPISMATLVFSILIGGYIYTILYALIGLSIKEEEQIQHAQLPITLLLFCSYGIGFYSCLYYNSAISHVALFIPTIMPFVAPICVFTKSVSSVEIITALVVTAVIAIILNYLIYRLYSPLHVKNQGGT